MLYGDHGVDVLAGGHKAERPAVARVLPAAEDLKLPTLVAAPERAARNDKLMVGALWRQVGSCGRAPPARARPM